MNIETFRNYCLAKPGTTEEFPFDENTLVFKVAGKMYSATDLEEFVSINLKCDPERAVELRERYSGVIPGYHMNKRHWNTVLTDGSIPDDKILEWINDSYDLVVKGLPKKDKEFLDR
ncbi:MAG: MmcQ/YjbR family DNA-binding protein [Cyclobacteriaceae bacterium]